MELGHFDKHLPIARERKAPQDQNHRVFCLETIKNFILNDKFYLKMTTIRAVFLQIRALFSNFQKRAVETSPPPHSLLVMRLLIVQSVKLYFYINCIDLLLHSLKYVQLSHTILYGVYTFYKALRGKWIK